MNVLGAIRNGPRFIFGSWVSDNTHSKEYQSGINLGWVFNLCPLRIAPIRTFSNWIIWKQKMTDAPL